MPERTAEAPVTPAVLRWAREAAGHSVTSAAQVADVLEERVGKWETGEERPSLAKLRALGDAYRRPIAFFFLPEPPSEPPPMPPDFRSSGGEWGPAVGREMLRARERREVLLDLVPDAHRFEPDTPNGINAAARYWRDRLAITIEDQATARDEQAAFRLWRDAFIAQGILVFQMSRVPKSRCRGFSLYHSPMPIIVLNGSDDAKAKVFTLGHELRHLTRRSGGVCDLGDAGMEAECNRFAGALLMPAATVVAFVEEGLGIPQLARRFWMSRAAMAIRLTHLGQMEQEDLDEYLRAVSEAEAEQDQPGFALHHRTHLRNVSPFYAEAVLDAYHNDRISWSDVTHYLEAKTATVERMEAELHRSAG